MRRNGVTASVTPRNTSAQKPARWMRSLSGRAPCRIACASKSALASGNNNKASAPMRKGEIRPRLSRQSSQDDVIACAYHDTRALISPRRGCLNFKRSTVPAVWQTATVVAVHERRRAPGPCACGSRRRRATGRASTTSCASRRPTATPRPARTRWRHRPTAAPRSTSPSSVSTMARCRRSSTTCWRSATSSRSAARSVGTSCGKERRRRCSSAVAPASCR